jgi:hypothetical protein
VSALWYQLHDQRIAYTNNCRYIPIYTTIAHLVAAVYLTYTVSLSLYQTYSAIRPSADTRERKHKRHLLVPLFGVLALLALGSDVYHKLSYLTLSYKVWAHERGVVVPPRYVSYPSHSNVEDVCINVTTASSQRPAMEVTGLPCT